MTPTERFLYWIRERHNIYLKRQRGEPKPWTEDKVLQNYFFTNPYRENDKTTVWFRENVRDSLRNSSEVLFATICFRWFNWIPTGEILVKKNLLRHWKLSIAKKYLRGRSKIFTGAFNISNSGSTKSKIDRVCDDYITPVWRNRKQLLAAVVECASMQQVHRWLRQYVGMGGSGFMSYEVVCDLRHTYLLEDATDVMTWSNPGPGAKRGLNRLQNKNLKSSVEDWDFQSKKLLELVLMRLRNLPRFEMREIEHSLCEFDKYERARLGTGRMKRRYNGT